MGAQIEQKQKQIFFSLETEGSLVRSLFDLTTHPLWSVHLRSISEALSSLVRDHVDSSEPLRNIARSLWKSPAAEACVELKKAPEETLRKS